MSLPFLDPPPLRRGRKSATPELARERQRKLAREWIANKRKTDPAYYAAERVKNRKRKEAREREAAGRNE